MTEVERLVAKEAIRSLKALYFRAMDTKEWHLLEHVFSSDAECDFRGADIDPVSGISAVPGATDQVLAEREAIIAGLREGLRDVVSVHAGLMPEIDLIDGHNATGVWSMSDILRFPAGPLAELRGWGHYHERYALVDGQWRITHLRLTRLAVDAIPRT